MNVKNLIGILVIGLLIASCTDKKSAEELTKMKADMKKADSICMADKQMLMDSIAMMTMQMDSMMALLPAPKNSTSSKSTSTKSTTTTTTTTKTDVMDSKGKSTEVDMSTKGKTDEKIDMKTKGKTTKSGGGN